MRGSLLDRCLNRLGWPLVDEDGDPATPNAGFWRGAMAGLWLQGRRRRDAWKRIGLRLANWTYGRLPLVAARHGVSVDQLDVLILMHSHGGQGGAFAASIGLLPGPRYFFVSVDTPMRTDMHAEYAAIGAVATRFCHLYSETGWLARFRWLGSWFGSRRCNYADVNMEIRGGHSGIVTAEPWISDQWPAVLKATEGRDDS